jgi:exodeoxyribonuclease VII large subunit
VFTGIGHEVDTSIADEVAYSWNKTPTACAVAIIGKVEDFMRQVDEAAQRIATVVLAALANSERRVANAVGRLGTLRTTAFESAKARINELAAQIVGYDPVVLMRRGWSITYGANGKVLKSVEGLDTRTELTTRLADGTLVSTITDIAKNTSTKYSTKESKNGSQK